VLIEFDPQLVLVDAPLPSFSCFSSCSVSHKVIGTEIIGISTQVGPRLGSLGYPPIHCAREVVRQTR
jgi:hypothetical protein